MSQLEGLLDRPCRYNNIDGTGELGIGFLLLGTAALQWLQVHSPQWSSWNTMYALFAWVAIAGPVAHYGTRAIKKRITWPRTGFVSYRTDTRVRAMIVAFISGALISTLVVVAPQARLSPTALPAVAGLLLTASYFRGFARAVVWKWCVAATLATGSLSLLLIPSDRFAALAADSWITRRFPAELVGASFVLFLGYGAILLISGLISLALYLRNTHEPATPGDR